MRRTTTTTQLGQKTYGTMFSTQILEMPAPKVDLRSSQGWLDVFEGAWVTELEPLEPLSADGIAELYALAEEFEECVSHTESNPWDEDE